MKKSSLITIIVLLSLVGLSIYFFKNKNRASTISKEASDFKFKDTASIDKIYIADKDGGDILIERKANGWMMGGGYRVRPDAIELLLETIANVEVQTPVSKKNTTGVLKIMAGKSVKIEIYSKGNKVKQYFVGFPTQDHLGTYMILTDLETGENYPDLFITHIPGFNGFLSTRYYADKTEWRDRLMCNYTPPQIKQIKLELNEAADSSFTIDLYSMQRFGLKIKNDQHIKFDESRLKQYIAYFQNLNCEYYLDKKDKVVDSLMKSAIPFAKLQILDRNNTTNVIEFYHKKALSEKNAQYGIDYKYDPDRMFVKFNNGKDFGVAQFFAFGKILQTYKYFVREK